MKKGFLLAVALVCSAGLASAQDDNFMQVFPNREGAQLVNKSYDANHNLTATMTTTVDKYYQRADGSDLHMSFVMTDPQGNVINEGDVDAYYEDGNFYIKMSNNMAMMKDVIDYLSMQNEMTADFLDYPNPMGDNSDLFYTDPVFAMDGGNYTIMNKDDRKDFVRVENHNREYVGAETIQTPAGEFQAYKITYDSDVTCHGKTTTYKGVEWYAPGAGIVRSEIYKGSELQNYTVLSSLTK